MAAGSEHGGGQGAWQARITAELGWRSGPAAPAVTWGWAPKLSVQEEFLSQSGGNLRLS